MAENENTEKKEAGDDGFDFTMFIGDEGANVLSTEQLNELKKKLPKWSIMPPAKYRDK